MRDKYNNEYSLYKGHVWLTKLDQEKELQGANVAIVEQNGEIRVLSYILVGKETDLDKKVWDTLRSYGWADKYCYKLLGEENKTMKGQGE